MVHEKFLFNSLISKSTVHIQSEAEYRSLHRFKDEKNYEEVDTGMWCPYSLSKIQQKATMNSCLEYLDSYLQPSTEKKQSKQTKSQTACKMK